MRVLRTLRRDSTLGLLLSALAVAVAALSAVAFFADRVERALTGQGAALQAADLVVEQGDVIPGDWMEAARARGLAVSRMLAFPSVVFHEGRPVLVQVKAVDEAYPLRGRLAVRKASGETAAAPAAGEAYLESRLLQKLRGVTFGDAIPVGSITLPVAGEVLVEPDRGGNLFQLAPRLMLHLGDVERAGLVGPASRVRHRLLVAGDPAELAAYRAWIAERAPPGTRLTDVQNARPELRTALERGRRFLALAALCASLLAGVAILLATRRYVDQALDGAAVLRTLGASGRTVLLRHLRVLAGVLLLGCGLGVLGGYLFQALLAALVGDWFGDSLPAAGARPALVGIVYGAVLLLGFSLPALQRVRQVPPLRVLRRELGPPELSGWLSWGLAGLVFAALVFWQVDDSTLAVAMLLVLASSLLILTGMGALLVRLLRRWSRLGGSAGAGLAALSRNPALVLWQIGGFGLGITLLLLLGLVRTDLIDAWQGTLAPDAPNHFLVNIQPEERAAVARWLGERGIANSGLYATTRARLTHINGETVNPDAFGTRRGRRLATREYSLGFGDAIQRDNRIIAGRTWTAGEALEGAFSIEQGVASALALSPGDRLTFDVAGQAVTAPVANVRTVSWDSFNVNFFVLGTTGLMRDLPVAYLSSIHIRDGQETVLGDIGEYWPSVSVLDLRPLLQQVRNIMDRGAHAVEAMFAFTVIAAFLVTWAAVQVSRDERTREIAVLRTLGAPRRHISQALLTEFGVLGLLAGTAAAMLASAAGWLFAYRLFDLNTGLNATVWLVGACGGGLGLAVFGLLVSRRLLDTPPQRVLGS